VNTDAQVRFQRNYYGAFAPKFDSINIHRRDEHYFALAVLGGLLDFLECTSVLDIGAGTGRAVRYLKERKPNVKIVGIEPVAAMRQQAYRLGVAESDIVDGNATNIPFPDRSFDVVMETGVFHHIPQPSRAVDEMLRVAKKAVFISDGNNMGQGSPFVRVLKQSLKSCGLWKLAYLIRSKGRGYWTSENDGLAYSFSVFDYYDQIRGRCNAVHIMNTLDAGTNLYRTAAQVALLGVKKD
jgi:ubiquinone/menaquinone biosynthesis C-methylase UbiE